MQDLVNKLQSLRTTCLSTQSTEQNGLKYATGVVVVLIVAQLGWRVISNKLHDVNETRVTLESEHDQIVPASITDIQLASTSSSPKSQTASFTSLDSRNEASPHSETEAQRSLALRVGRIEQTPSRANLIKLDKLPETEQDIWRKFTDAKDRCGKMLPEGNLVLDGGSIVQGQIGTYGRINALTIGLNLEEAGRNKLPSMVVNEVLNYFEQHRLSVQPMLYHDESGQFYFGTECQTAFYNVSHPTVTQRPEPMITSAVARFRALGVTSEANSKTRPDHSAPSINLGRTLAMAFAFEQSQGLATESSKRVQAVEFIFLHLPKDSDPRHPRLEAFITSNQRQQLHRVDTSTQLIQSNVPTISSKIRFDKTVLLGMYPAEPVVTDIQFRSSGAIPMQTVLELTRRDSLDGALSVTEILDIFDTLQTQNIGQPSTRVTTEPWLEKVRRRKEMELEATLHGTATRR